MLFNILNNNRSHSGKILHVSFKLIRQFSRHLNVNFAILGDDSASTDVESSSEALVSEGL